MPRGVDTRFHSSRRPPQGYGNYSNPATADAQRATDREFDRSEAKDKDRMAAQKYSS